MLGQNRKENWGDNVNNFHSISRQKPLPIREEEASPELLAQIWSQRAYILAEAPAAAATGQTLDLLIFRLGNERYGVSVSHIHEIYPLERITPVPRTPAFSVGVFSARGRILSVVDLKAFFGMTPLALTQQTKIIVVSNSSAATNINRIEIGILADEVADVNTIFNKDIEPPLTTHNGMRAEYLHGMTSDLLVVLNLDAILEDERLIVYEEMLN
jgi:purine-binding chemotaxis protein CheW